MQAKGRGGDRRAPARPMTLRRLVGLDRSGPPPPQTRSGAPLRPLTMPNAIGFVRLTAIPVFLALAFSSEEGRSVAAALVFAFVSGGDYLDGLLARATGQYSRLGAILDPIVDRMTVLAGVAVTWHFELLPRWALAVLAAREVVTVVLARAALRRGKDIEINWLGRLAVWPVMGAIFLAVLVETEVAGPLLIVGVAMAIIATAMYAARGVARVGTGHPEP